VVARGDIAVAVVMKDSPVWSCHGDGTQGAESQQEAAGETGHNRDRKSTSALMGTYRSLRRRAKNCYCFYIQLMLYNIFLLASSDKCLLLLFMIVYFCSSFVVIEVLIK